MYCKFLLCFIVVNSLTSVFSYNDARHVIVRARIQSCTGCQLEKYPEVKRFIEMDIRDLVYLDDRDVTPLPLVLETSDEECGDEQRIEEKTRESFQITPDGLEDDDICSPEVLVSETMSDSSSSHFRYSLTSPIDLECMELPYSSSILDKFLERFRTPTPVEDIPIKISQARLQELMEEKPLQPQKITFSLKETPTFFLLERPSLTELDGTPEGDIIKHDNECYEYLTVGEGRRRYTKNAETQTKLTVWKSKDVWAPAADVKDNIAEASTYDLYQSFTESLPNDGVTFKQIPGLLPEIVFYNKYDEELEIYPLKCTSREDCCKILLEKGFKRNFKTLEENNSHNDL